MIDEDDYFEVDELPSLPRRDIPTADRDLLELAARALGAVQVEDIDGEDWLRLHFADGALIQAWNPLAFSGDAFDLAVNLGMAVDVLSDSAISLAYVDGQNQARELHSSDAKAATRRAIVRAAAAIRTNS